MATAIQQGEQHGQQGEDRRRFLGASDMGAVLGVDPFKTPLQLYEEKVGLAPSFAGNQHTKRGQKLEQLAAEDFMERTGKVVHRLNDRLQHPVYPFITGKIDRRVVGERAIVEIKCPSLGSFHKIKREGLHEGYIVQMQTYLGLMGAELGYWHIFCADQMDAVPFPVEFDPRLYNQIIDRAAAFWLDHVLRQVPPTAQAADEAAIEIRRAEGSATVVDLTTEPEFVDAAAMLAEAKALAREAQALEETARARVLDRLMQVAQTGTGIVAVAGQHRVSYTLAKGRSSFDKAALALAKPWDHDGTIEYLAARFERDERELERELVEVKCQLDLGQFNKVGSPYSVLCLTTIGGRD